GWGGGILLGLALLGLFGWQWFELRHRVSQTQEQLARRLAEGATQLRDARMLAEGAQQALQTQADKMAVLESRLAEVTTQQAALEGLYQELSRGRDEWLLAEVDQLVGLAAQQLQFAGNVQGAVALLNNADTQLARSERPQFVNLRKALAKDLQKLRSVPLVDVAGIALRIENVALAADKMTLAFEARPQNPPVPTAVAARARPRANEIVREPTQLDFTQWWKRWTAEVWGEVHNLIRIERFDRPDPAVLAPQNTVFLRENVKLRLLGARLALLGRDQATFKGELRQAVQWLEKYFDPRDRSVAGALETLKPLLANELSIDPPNLTESQSALRAVKLSADRIVR
ncbi:MAG TPA: uroporphyrinogen-III C-methyltransferase, partial [Rhodocyclaceae bacterium]|nr:uroporphyrinogen-III C-methyltransferase [Rhodocyclaceae bacterium]